MEDFKEGLYPATVTPFDSGGAFDPDKLVRLMERNLAEGARSGSALATMRSGIWSSRKTGRLATAPSSGRIELSFSGEPVQGTWGLLRFDDPNGKLDAWTVSAPAKYGNLAVSIIKNQYGFSLHTSQPGLVLSIW